MKPARIVLAPTAAGVFMLLAVLALLATAINYGNNLVFALAFVLLSVMLSSGWQCRRNLVGLEWLPAAMPMAFAGETVNVVGSVRETSGRRREPVSLRGGAAAIVPASDAATLELPLPAPARGKRKIAGLRLVSLHPLGLWRAQRALPTVEALIYPRPQGERPLPGRAPNPAHRQRESGDWRGLRAYAPGDSPRRVNWRVYARGGELTVNDFDGGKGGAALWLDAAACAGEVESRLSQLCQWVCEAERQGLEYGLRLDDGAPLPPGRGRAHRQACLKRLALYGET